MRPPAGACLAPRQQACACMHSAAMRTAVRRQRALDTLRCLPGGDAWRLGGPAAALKNAEHAGHAGSRVGSSGAPSQGRRPARPPRPAPGSCAGSGTATPRSAGRALAPRRCRRQVRSAQRPLLASPPRPPAASGHLGSRESRRAFVEQARPALARGQRGRGRGESVRMAPRRAAAGAPAAARRRPHLCLTAPSRAPEPRAASSPDPNLSRCAPGTRARPPARAA